MSSTVSVVASYAKRLIPDRLFLEIQYYRCFHRRLNLKNPRFYTEKLQWIKLYDRRPAYSSMVDKIEAKKFVGDKIGKAYIIPTIAEYDSVDAIDWNTLPESFVIKCTHDSKSTYICRNKKDFSISDASAGLRKAMKTNGYWFGREWPYKALPPRIIVEKLLVGGKTEYDSLDDYKVLCFEGKPKLIEVLHGRFRGALYQDFYDISWNLTDIEQKGEKKSGRVIPRPSVLDNMLALSEKLSAGLHHIRVDWYIVDNHLYFGELTFFDASGFDPFVDEKDDLLLGSWINLNK